MKAWNGGSCKGIVRVCSKNQST